MAPRLRVAWWHLAVQPQAPAGGLWRLGHSAVNQTQGALQRDVDGEAVAKSRRFFDGVGT